MLLSKFMFCIKMTVQHHGRTRTALQSMASLLVSDAKLMTAMVFWGCRGHVVLPKKLLEHGQTHFLLSIPTPFKLEGSFGGSKAFNILWGGIRPGWSTCLPTFLTEISKTLQVREGHGLYTDQHPRWRSSKGLSMWTIRTNGGVKNKFCHCSRKIHIQK